MPFNSEQLPFPNSRYFSTIVLLENSFSLPENKTSRVILFAAFTCSCVPSIYCKLKGLIRFESWLNSGLPFLTKIYPRWCCLPLVAPCVHEVTSVWVIILFGDAKMGLCIQVVMARCLRFIEGSTFIFMVSSVALYLITVVPRYSLLIHSGTP